MVALLHHDEDELRLVLLPSDGHARAADGGHLDAQQAAHGAWGRSLSTRGFSSGYTALQPLWHGVTASGSTGLQPLLQGMAASATQGGGGDLAYLMPRGDQGVVTR